MRESLTIEKKHKEMGKDHSVSSRTVLDRMH